MKLLVASDIHGSAFYCERLMDIYRTEGAERMLLLGDILYHGPRNDLPEGYSPKRVAEMLNALRSEIFCVRGNCDSEVDQMVLEFPIMAEYAVFEVAGRLIYATHGHIWNEKRLPPISEGDILLHGHTHVPLHMEANGFTLCNPGSVSLPKEGSRRSYMIIDGCEMVWKDMEGHSYMRRGL